MNFVKWQLNAARLPERVVPKKVRRRALVGSSLSLAVLFYFSAAIGGRAEDVEDFFKGKALDLIVASTPGGGYDAMARVYARHLPRHISGAPSVVVRNMPGGGGLVAANYLYNTASRDGTVIATVQQGVLFLPLFGEKQARFDALKFNWIGNANSEVGIFLVWHTSKVKTIQDAFSTEIISAATGGGSSTAFTYRLLNGLLGTKLKIVTGYPGANDSFMALERGEAEGFFTVWTSMKARSNLLRNNQVRMLVQIAMEKASDLPNVPLASEFIKSDFDRQVLELSQAPGTLGRPYIAPPGVPPERLRILQTAFVNTSKDEVFRKELASVNLEADNVMSGPDAAALLKHFYQSPKDVVAKVESLTKPND
jgi:tripartite-type tricarboxylate transporter receptor subunit TctC